MCNIYRLFNNRVLREGVNMFLCIDFQKNRKRINPFTLLLAKALSQFSPPPFLNAETFSSQLCKLILNDAKEGETTILDSVRYECLKNRKNCVFRLTCSSSDDVYIVKIYAYTKAWYADVFF